MNLADYGAIRLNEEPEVKVELAVEAKAMLHAGYLFGASQQYQVRADAVEICFAPSAPILCKFT